MSDESTAVHRACHDNNQEALQVLIEKGAQLELRDVEGRAPLHWAATIRPSQPPTQEMNSSDKENEGCHNSQEGNGVTGQQQQPSCLQASYSESRPFHSVTSLD